MNSVRQIWKYLIRLHNFPNVKSNDIMIISSEDNFFIACLLNQEIDSNFSDIVFKISVNWSITSDNKYSIEALCSELNSDELIRMIIPTIRDNKLIEIGVN